MYSPVRLGLDPEEVGIISPYRKQTTKLRQMMGALLNMDASGIRVGSVEEFQVGMSNRFINKFT
jgi:superfamily I DNA and/or RNA helicase